MEPFKKNKKIIMTVIGLGIFLLSLAAVVFYLYKRCRSEYNGDFTDTLLWANAAVTSGHFYSPDYWYAYFLPFSGIPLMIPIVAAISRIEQGKCPCMLDVLAGWRIYQG